MKNVISWRGRLRRKVFPVQTYLKGRGFSAVLNIATLWLGGPGMDSDGL